MQQFDNGAQMEAQMRAAVTGRDLRQSPLTKKYEFTFHDRFEKSASLSELIYNQNGMLQTFDAQLHRLAALEERLLGETETSGEDKAVQPARSLAPTVASELWEQGRTFAAHIMRLEQTLARLERVG